MLFDKFFPAISNAFKTKVKMFTKPLKGVVFNHLMAEESIRNSFIRTFTPLKKFVSSTLHTNTFKDTIAGEKLFDFIRSDEFNHLIKNDNRFGSTIAFIENMTQRGNLNPFCPDQAVTLRDDVITELTLDLDYLNEVNTVLDSFAENFEEIKDALLSMEDGCCEMLCSLDSDKYALVRVHISTVDALGNRLHEYHAIPGPQQLLQRPYWNQLETICDVYITTREPSAPSIPAPRACREHLQPTDTRHPADQTLGLPHYVFITFPGAALEPVDAEDAEERWWLDLLSTGGERQALPDGCPPLAAAAYARIRADALPPAARAKLANPGPPRP
jgi:hypothetical protein